MEEGLKLNQESKGDDRIAAASGLDEDSVVGSSNLPPPTNLFPGETPDFYAARMVALADVTGKHTLEPSAGRGNLARAIRSAGPQSLLCIELNEELAFGLFNDGFNVAHKDFLRFNTSRYFDRIVMNPPRQAFAHIEKAICLLAPGGVLVAMHRMDCENAHLIGTGLPVTVHEIPENTFMQDGKSVPSRIIVIRK